MIARIWHGQATLSKAEAYVSFLGTKVFSELRNIDGHQGAFVLQRSLLNRGEVEFIVITLWESMEAIRFFAGSDPSVAVVEDEARALLSTFDDHVEHFEVASSAGIDFFRVRYGINPENNR